MKVVFCLFTSAVCAVSANPEAMFVGAVVCGEENAVAFWIDPIVWCFLFHLY